MVKIHFWRSVNYRVIATVMIPSTGEIHVNKSEKTLNQLDKNVMINVQLFYFDLRPGPKMLFQGDAPEGSDTFQWPVIERDRVGGLRLIIWDKVKVPLCHYRVMHRKRVTSELHDSYFRLMMIKHSISKIEWASNDYITQLSSMSQLSWRSDGVIDEMW